MWWQNRNYKMVLCWMHVVNKMNIELAVHKFLVTEHSYLPNDQDSGFIEKAKKKKQHVFFSRGVVQHYERSQA